MFYGVYSVAFTFYLLLLVICSEDSVVGTVTSRGSIPGRGRVLFFLQVVQTGSGVSPTSYSVRINDFFRE